MTIPAAPFGVTGAKLSRIGLGTWAIGGGEWLFGWGPQDDADSDATIARAVEVGIDWIDTAAVYGLGHSEGVVGRAVATLPEAERPYVFTKCGRVWHEGDPTPRTDLDPDSIRRQCDASLLRLGVERIDLLQIHWPPADGRVEEAWTAMAALADAGKARWIGVSNFAVPELEACERIRHVDSLQPPLSLIQRTALDAILAWCVAHGTGAIVHSPLQSGLLTGSFTRERASALDEADWRRRSDQFREPRLLRNLELVQLLRPIAARAGCTLAELAVAWTLAQPGVTGAIVGARRPEHVADWAAAARIELSPGDLAEIAAAIETSGADAEPPVAPT